MPNNRTTMSKIINDLKAGGVVFLVALPLCLGIASAQHAPFHTGIIAGIIGGIVVGILSGSKLSVTGPAAGLTSIAAAAILSLHLPSFLCAVLIAGMLQIVLGLFRFGVISYYFPTSVIKGMLSAIAIILIMKQLPHIFGDDLDPLGDFTFFQEDGKNTFSELLSVFEGVRQIPMAPFLNGIFCLAALIVWDTVLIKKYNFLKGIPAPLLIVTGGILLQYFFSQYYPPLAISTEHLVNVPLFNSVDGFKDIFNTPDFSGFVRQEVWIVGLTLGLVASLETLLNVEATDKLDPNKNQTPANRELLAQGVGNICCGLIGGIPITSVVVRSSANINAGALTKVSTITHGTLLAGSFLLFPSLLNLIPISSLAAILLYTGYKLTKVSIYTTMFKAGKQQFLPFITTIVVMLFSGILYGIMAGTIVAIYYILKNNLKTPYKTSQRIINERLHILITLSEDVTFLNKSSFRDLLKNIPDGSVVLIDSSLNKIIDPDITEMLYDFMQAAPEKSIEIEFIDQ